MNVTGDGDRLQSLIWHDANLEIPEPWMASLRFWLNQLGLSWIPGKLMSLSCGKLSAGAMSPISSGSWLIHPGFWLNLQTLAYSFARVPGLPTVKLTLPSFVIETPQTGQVLRVWLSFWAMSTCAWPNAVIVLILRIRLETFLASFCPQLRSHLIERESFYIETKFRWSELLGPC